MKKNNDESLFVEEEYNDNADISNMDIEEAYMEISNISPFDDYINNNDIDSTLNMLNRCASIRTKEKDETIEDMKNKLKC